MIQQQIGNPADYEIEPAGELHYKGDVRDGATAPYVRTPRHGVVTPTAATYDEATDRTTVEYGRLVGLR